MKPRSATARWSVAYRSWSRVLLGETEGLDIVALAVYILLEMTAVKSFVRRVRQSPGPRPRGAPFHLESRTLGALPVINHFLDRLRLDALWGRYPLCQYE